MAVKTNLRFCGTEVSTEELQLIVEIVADCSGLSRTELAHTVCELLDWRRPNGALKAHECRQFLEDLEARALCRLPANQGSPRKQRNQPAATSRDLSEWPETVAAKLSEVGPLELELVTTKDHQRQWRAWVDRFHYLGCKVPYGAHLRYFVRISRPRPQRVGCIQMSSPAWRMAPRDRWIGWDEAQRVRGLQQIVQNSRFLLLPWVQIPYLASATLARLARRIAADWEARYCVQPVLLETLVDPARFAGTCYRAANWIALGQTTGRGRMDRKHERHGASPKTVLVYPLCRKARTRLLQA